MPAQISPKPETDPNDVLGNAPGKTKEIPSEAVTSGGVVPGVNKSRIQHIRKLDLEINNLRKVIKPLVDVKLRENEMLRAGGVATRKAIVDSIATLTGGEQSLSKYSDNVDVALEKCSEKSLDSRHAKRKERDLSRAQSGFISKVQKLIRKLPGEFDKTSLIQGLKQYKNMLNRHKKNINDVNNANHKGSKAHSMVMKASNAPENIRETQESFNASFKKFQEVTKDVTRLGQAVANGTEGSLALLTQKAREQERLTKNMVKHGSAIEKLKKNEIGLREKAIKTLKNAIQICKSSR